MRPLLKFMLPLSAAVLLAACNDRQAEAPAADGGTAQPETVKVTANPYHAYVEDRLDIYAPVTLEADLSGLSDDQKRMIALLIDASDIMDGLFWQQAYGDRESLLKGIEHEPTRRFVEINYGPWDRLNGDRPFVEGVGEKPLGANFYPADMSKQEFQAWQQPGKDGLYSLVRRDENGNLELVPYHEAYAGPLKRAAALLREAAALAENEAFRRYLELRADALVSDEYLASDMAWMEMKDNAIDVVIGPIETYEDRLFGYRAAYESYVLLKDLAWSEKLARFARYLPELQDGLPVPDEYKREEPGTNADLNAYDVLYYAGHSNAGSKTIAINLPNDERVQLEMGTRRLQLKNAMRAKFERILMPIAGELIAEEQRGNITFDAFFKNVMFHEVAHGLGIKNTINGRGTVREALKETFSPLEEGKADILGLYMIGELFKKGELQEGELLDHYVTFLAGLFRSVRFGASSAHGQANMIQFNYFRERGAFTRDETTGHYRVNFEKMQQAVRELAGLILRLQGDGDYPGAVRLLAEKGVIGPQLKADLQELSQAGIPVDIVFRQGKQVLGLTENTIGTTENTEKTEK